MKKSLSKMTSGGEVQINTGTYQSQDRIHDQGDNSPGNSNRDTNKVSAEDPSVSSWEFPIIENDYRDSKKEDFKDTLARLEREAYEKGFEQGHKDSLTLEQKKIEEMGKELESIFSELRDLKKQIYKESEGELLKLGILIAKKIIGEEIKIHKHIIGNTIQSALKFITDKRMIKIIINPEDMEEVRRLLPDIAKVTNGGKLQLTEDNSIQKGGCILETGFGKINASINDQLDMIEEEIVKQYELSLGDLNESVV